MEISEKKIEYDSSVGDNAYNSISLDLVGVCWGFVERISQPIPLYLESVRSEKIYIMWCNWDWNREAIYCVCMIIMAFSKSKLVSELVLA